MCPSMAHRHYHQYETGVVENTLPTLSRLTCIPLVAFRILEKIHVSELYGQ